VPVEISERAELLPSDVEHRNERSNVIEQRHDNLRSRARIARDVFGERRDIVRKSATASRDTSRGLPFAFGGFFIEVGHKVF
jgi:hypothetical protein